MKEVFKHKANVDLGDLTSWVLINTVSQIFLSTATAYFAFIPYTEFYFHYASASETNALWHPVKRSFLTSVLVKKCSFSEMFAPKWFFIFSGTTYKLQLDSTIGTDVWRKVYILKYVITLLQLISTVTLIYFAIIQYVECSLTLITLDDMQTVLLSLIRTVYIC